MKWNPFYLEYEFSEIYRSGKIALLLCVIGILSMFNQHILKAQPFPINSYSEMHWRNIGSNRAGRALAVAGIPGNSSTFYFGSVDGGIWKTTNAGHTWEPISDNQMNPSIGALAIAPSDSKILYAGTGEADMRSDITYGDGMYKSLDGGVHWQHIGLQNTRHIGKILIDPNNPNVVLVAAVGHAYGSNEERGVFYTSDGGTTWTKVLYRNAKTGAADLAWDEKNPFIVYASLWQVQRVPWGQYQPEEGPGSGLFKSIDQGKTWKEIKSPGLPAGPYGRIGLAVVKGSRGEIVFAIISAQNHESGLYRSDNGGANWRLINNDPRVINRMWYFGRVFLDPQDADIIYLPSKGLMRSTDGGKNFSVIKSSPGGDDYHFLWIDPREGHHFITASDQGATLSLDNGSTWSSWYNQPTGQFYHVVTDNQFPYRVYGAQQDNGTVSITSRSDFGEITFRDWYSIGGGESGYVAPDPKNPDIVYSGSTFGGIHRFDRTTGQFQNVSPSLLGGFGTPMAERTFRFVWTAPLVFDPINSKKLYLGSQMVLETEDGGLHWNPVSPDLKGAKPNQKPSNVPLSTLNASARGWGVVYTIAPSPLVAGTIWAGTDDGIIQLTVDNGRHWENITPEGLKPWSKISLIEASSFDAGAAYVAVDRHRLDDMAPYIFLTRDFGKHWSRIDKGIGPFSFVHVVRADPARKGLLYAGTETGVYVSFDDGSHWQPLQLNMPMVSVRDLAVHENDLIAGTHGRAFWILDNLTVLQQLNKQILSYPVYLFQPDKAIRIRPSVNTDTPLPPEIPHGENPPAGAVFDYYLQGNPARDIALDILDDKGNLIRHYSSEDTLPPPSERLYFMDDWLPRYQPLTGKTGHNRFVWDLRYPSPPTRHTRYSMAANAGRGTVKEPQGPLVLPGTYKARLTLNGESMNQSFRVEMDPRVRISDSILKKQLRFALQIWNAIAEQSSLKGILDILSDRLIQLKQQNISDKKLKSDLIDLELKVRILSYLLNDGGLVSLETAVMGADREPTSQMYSGFEVLVGQLKSAKRQWESIQNEDYPGMNRRLEKYGFAKIIIPSQEPARLKID